MKKFLIVHDYSENMKAKVATYSLKAKVSIWWEYLKNVKVIREEELSWSEFEGNFKRKYLTRRYFDCKSKKFYELKMEQMSYEEYTTKFLELLRYVLYLKDEKSKIERYVSGMPQSFKGKIEFNEPKALEDAVKKLNQYYE